MTKNRLEAFSDAVIAIIMTIMVLELRAPEGTGWHELSEMKTEFFVYAMSFLTLGIYWNNHHHLFHAVTRVNGPMLWANTHLLFWLSVIPFTTAWMGEHLFQPVPTAVYGGVLFFAGIGWMFLVKAMIRLHGRDSTIARAIGTDYKGRLSGLGYFIGTAIAIPVPHVAMAIYIGVSLMWFIPDKRIERALQASESAD